MRVMYLQGPARTSHPPSTNQATNMLAEKIS